MGKLVVGAVLLALLVGLIDTGLDEFFALDACMQTGLGSDVCEGR